LSFGNPTNAQFLIAFAIDAAVGGAVWVHADRNGVRHQTAWAIFVVFFLVVALPLYVLHFRHQRRKGTLE
jgi:hypothetical protein